MTGFKDCLSRQWVLRLTIADIPRLRLGGWDLNAKG